MTAGDPVAVIKALGKAKDWLLHHYIECWTKEIDEGLEEWLKTSNKIAVDLFVDENSDRIWDDDLQPFMNNNIGSMLGTNPMNIVTSCIGIPEWVSKVLNPAEYLNKELDNIKEDVSDIFDPLNVIKDNFRDFMFKAAFGMSFDTFKDYYKNSETYAPRILGVETTKEIIGLLDIQSGGALNDETCAIVHNTIVLNKLILLNASNLDQLLFRYNVGNIYLPTVTPNVMLGFLKSLDGNHQWRKHAPSRPITEPNRSFSINGMPLWVDCLARKNFFKKVFKDWTSKGVSMLYKDSEACEYISSLSPVSTSFRLLTNHDRCTPSYAEVTLTNHQSTQQHYTIYVTVESPKDEANNTKIPLNDYENGTPRTEWCDKTVPPKDIPYSPIIIKPDNISYKNIFFYKVRRGTLQASSTTCKDETVLVQLPNCYNVDAKARVYVLREVYTAKKPVEEHNTKIPPNPSELLLDPVKAYFDEDYVIKCDPCIIPSV